jgi:hypothetical protein
MRSFTTPVIAAVLACGMASVRAEEVSLVVAQGSSVQTLAKSQAVGYFTGRLRTLPNGEAVQPLDLPPDHPARATFYRLLTGMSLAQINSYWARLVFSGQIQPPQVVDSEAAMAKALRSNPRAIGYVVDTAEDGKLRVVLTLREAS